MDSYLTFPGQDEERRARDAIHQNMSTSPNAPLRLFILGIGDTVSSGVCKTLADAGGGEYLLAVSKESILPKCTGLLRAGKTSTIKDVSVNWTAETSPGHGPPAQPLIQQSPPELSIPEVYPFSRSIYFAIIHTDTVPRQVVIRGNANGEEVFIHVDVESVKFGRRMSEPPFIHTLAAHRLIRDLEDGRTKGKRSETAQREEIVRLGKYYQLASSHTSFVAVDHGEVIPHRQKPKTPNHSMSVSSLIGTVWQYLANPTTLFGSLVSRSWPKQGHSNGLPGGWTTPDSADSGVPSQSGTEYSDGGEDGDDWASQHSDNSFSTLSSLESYSSIEIVPPPRRPRRSGPQRRGDRAPPPQIPYAPPPPASPTTGGVKEKFKPPPIYPLVEALAKQMSASGSFKLTDDLGTIVGRNALDEAKLWGDEELAATALAMVFLEKHLGDHLEVYQVLMEKGKEFVKNHPNGGRFTEMLDRARAISQP